MKPFKAASDCCLFGMLRVPSACHFISGPDSPHHHPIPTSSLHASRGCHVMSHQQLYLAPSILIEVGFTNRH
jgi:hypothetical protein